MRPFHTLLLLLLTITLATAATNNDPALLGVDLGSTHIHAVYFNGTTPIPVARIAGSKEYQAYMSDSLEYAGTHDPTRMDEQWLMPVGSQVREDKTATSMLRQVLSHVLEVSNLVTEQPLRICEISIPEHFNQSSRTQALKALGRVSRFNLEIDLHLRAHFSHFCTALTYPYDNCIDQHSASYDMPVGDWDDRALIIQKVFGRAKAFLPGYAPWGPIFLPYLKAEAPAIKDLLQQGVPELLKSHRKHVESIILSGELTLSEIASIEQFVATEFPELAGKIKKGTSSYGPQYVAAVGAACRAKSKALHPDYYINEITGYRGAPWEGHDEL